MRLSVKQKNLQKRKKKLQKRQEKTKKKEVGKQKNNSRKLTICLANNKMFYVIPKGPTYISTIFKST